MQNADAEDQAARERAILALAEKERGELTASQVAKTLNLRLDEADRLLTGMVGDGSRVEVDFDDEGVVRYVFRELVPRREAPKLRVEAVEEEPELESRRKDQELAERK
jgi:hypothetical protein